MEHIDFTKMLSSVVSDSYRELIKETMQTQPITTNAEALLALCKIITNKIDIYTRQQYIRQAQKKITLYKNRNTQLDKKEEAEIMIYATQLIYQLRSFIHGEDIVFHIATRDEEGKYKESAFIPQEEILRNLSQVRKNAIGVNQILQSSLIQKYANDTMDLHRQNLWRQVEYLAEPSKYTGKNIKKIDMRKPGAKEAHWAYQSQKKDIYVYSLYAKNKRMKYYDTKGNNMKKDLQPFNNGWLWEWYNSILYGENDDIYSIITQDIKKGSIKYVIQQQDYIAGTKQGDFQDYLGRQVQSKYGNNKIISYNNIRNIIYNLEVALTIYVTEGKSAADQLITVLQEHFFPESVELGSKYANEKLEQLFSKLDTVIQNKN